MVDDLKKYRDDLKQEFGFDIPEIPLVKKGDYGFLMNEVLHDKSPLFFKLIFGVWNTLFYHTAKKKIEWFMAKYNPFTRKIISRKKKMAEIDTDNSSVFDNVAYHELVHAYQHSLSAEFEEALGLQVKIMKYYNEPQKVEKLIEKTFVDLSIFEGQAMHYSYEMLRKQLREGKITDASFLDVEYGTATGETLSKELHEMRLPIMSQYAPSFEPKFIFDQASNTKENIMKMADLNVSLDEKTKLGSMFLINAYPLGLFYFRTILQSLQEKGMSHSEIVIKTIENHPDSLEKMVGQAASLLYQRSDTWKKFLEEQHQQV